MSRFLSNTGKDLWKVVGWILKYLKVTSKMCLYFGGAEQILEGYTNSNMAGNLDGRKSSLGFLFTFVRGPISWQSKLQKWVALSITETEYIAAEEARKEMLWVKWFLQELGIKKNEYKVHYDSQSALNLCKNFMQHSRTKHINILYITEYAKWWNNSCSSL